jgi:hypothetical protein
MTATQAYLQEGRGGKQQYRRNRLRSSCTDAKLVGQELHLHVYAVLLNCKHLMITRITSRSEGMDLNLQYS